MGLQERTAASDRAHPPSGAACGKKNRKEFCVGKMLNPRFVKPLDRPLRPRPTLDGHEMIP